MQSCSDVKKAKVTKVLNGTQTMSKTQALLAMERLSVELAQPGAMKALVSQ
ncbi:MAG: hypothetical protein NT027_16980 [Proteobacteria bacterium]|nr:hypothetical protein [Pseudomonadota bacterium]